MSASRLTKVALKIPKRIERGPTDILRALASTVKFIPGAPDALLHDDPYLLPSRPQDQAHYSLSRISGRNTAKFLLNKHPELFYRDDAEPKIRAFNPPEEYRNDMEFEVDDLKWCIDHNDPVNGVIAYKALTEKRGVEIDRETLLQFLELICYSNEDPMFDLEEHQKSYFTREKDRLVYQNWRNNGIASKIFNTIKQDVDPPRVYSAIIAGLSKFNEHQVAKEVYDEFKEFFPDEALYVDAYAYLLSSVPNLNSAVTTAHAAVEEIIRHMEQFSVKPNLLVFNSILDVYKRFNCDSSVSQKACQIMNDMRDLSIEPSLFTYSCLLNIMVKSREVAANQVLINSLLSYILSNGVAVQQRDERDQTALMNMMNLFANRLNNMQWASQLYKISLKRPNLFPSSGVKSVFYDVYFKLMVTTEKLDVMLSFYQSHVPAYFRPSPEVYDAFAEALDLYQADEATVGSIGQDVIKFRLAEKLKNDTIFRRDPKYVEDLEAQMQLR